MSGCAQARASTAAHATRRCLTPIRALPPAGARRCALQQQVWVARPPWHFMRAAHACGAGAAPEAGRGSVWRCRHTRNGAQPWRAAASCHAVALMLWLGWFSRAVASRAARWAISARATPHSKRWSLTSRTGCAHDQPPHVLLAGGSRIAATAPGALQQRHGAHPHDPVQGSGPDLTCGQNVRTRLPRPCSRC